MLVPDRRAFDLGVERPDFKLLKHTFKTHAGAAASAVVTGIVFRRSKGDGVRGGRGGG